MEELQSPIDKQTMVSSFLEIAVGQTTDTAKQFLQATSWKLEEAIQLFYVGNEGVIATPSAYSSPLENDRPRADQSSGGMKEDIVDGNAGQDDIDGVRAPIPVKREVLYDNAMLYGPRMGYSTHEAHSVVPFRNFNEEMKRAGVWDQGGTSVGDSLQDNLASLYRPPFALMHHGPFEKAKDAAKFQDKWFLVNVQSTKEFSSHMLNRDTWANEAVAQTISSNFIFWQVYDDTEEGRKVSTYYKLDSFPVILVIDPITGQKMRSWRGMVQAESLLENLLPFLDGSPKDHHVSLSHKRPREGSQTPAHKVPEAPVAADATNEEDEELLQALAASMEGTKDAIGGITTIDKDVTDGEKEEEQMPPPKKATYPPLPEEPTGDRNLLCRVGVRLPDGRRLQRSFWRTDPIELLWSFCSTHLEEAEQRPFRLTQAIPGASNVLDYDSKLTFAESGLANSMISVTWE
ncbi:plant UBX domain-containing protein 7 isoform X1 [Rhododendron vialii]|uniref:plant UBX domain-containing protein 7 isoform X1 n=1 Tax=Rhododendron vialii TaxID=182163 RepID=UPI00265E91F8|nr:plant UBX domain-containing protein 7 isoform X1 [Rhododendron vialii]